MNTGKTLKENNTISETEELNEMEEFLGMKMDEQKERMYECSCKMDKQESNIERWRRFYETYGAKMIHEKFPEYEERIAVGMVGEGSDCFECDDEISIEKDYGMGICMWLCEEDYNKIGKFLQKECDILFDQFEKMCGRNFFTQRRVSTINFFYNQILGTGMWYKDTWDFNYYRIADEQFATAVNGVVFRDDLGVFLGIRNKILEYYPDDIWKMKLSDKLRDFTKYVQKDYPRMMARKDYVTADLCIAKGVEIAMDLVFLLNKTYAPYYKWKRKVMGRLEKLQIVGEKLEQIALLHNQKDAWKEEVYCSDTPNRKDKYVAYFDEIADAIADEMQKQGLISKKQNMDFGLYSLEIAMLRVTEYLAKQNNSSNEN